MRIEIGLAIATVLASGAATPALAGNCGGSACSSRVAVKGSSVVPPPDGSEFAARGDLFSSSFFDVVLSPNGSRQIDLGFNVNFGFGNVSTLYLNENGIVSFLRPLSALSGSPISARRSATSDIPFSPVRSLADFGVPVIAPFYADLKQGSGAGDGRLTPGDITVQYGAADPYANGGAYSLRDARPAVRITWYGLTTGGADAPVYAQLLLSSDTNGLSNFEFRYGTLDSPGQDGDGSIAGFSLGENFLQFSGPYRDGTPTFFEFQDGKLLNGLGVPEPAEWMLLITGFAMIGGALRVSRKRAAAQALRS